mgnify:CR=1 FL=1
MFKAFSGALSLALTLLVLNWLLPGVFEQLIAAMSKILTAVNLGLDVLLTQMPH